MVFGVLGKKGLTAHYFFCFSIIEDAVIGSALSPSLASSFSQGSLGPWRTTSSMSSPRGSDASVTKKGKRWPFSRKAVEQEPTATMLQLDAPRGNVNTVVNDTIRSTYPVSDVIDMREDALNPTVLTMVLSEERGHVYQFQRAHDLAVFRLTLLEVAAGTYTMIRFPRTVLRKGNLKKQGKTGLYFERFAVVVPQKLFIMHSRNSFFPSSTVSLIDVKPDFDESQQTIHLQVEGRDYMLKGMSQQDTKGWQQALTTACMLKYDVVPLTEEVLLQEQQRAEDMLQAVTTGAALSPTGQQPLPDTPQVEAGQVDESSQSAALQSKMQMLRDLGFLSQPPPESDPAYEQQSSANADQASPQQTIVSPESYAAYGKHTTDIPDQASQLRTLVPPESDAAYEPQTTYGPNQPSLQQTFADGQLPSQPIRDVQQQVQPPRQSNPDQMQLQPQSGVQTTEAQQEHDVEQISLPSDLDSAVYSQQIHVDQSQPQFEAVDKALLQHQADGRQLEYGTAETGQLLPHSVNAEGLDSKQHQVGYAVATAHLESDRHNVGSWHEGTAEVDYLNTEHAQQQGSDNAGNSRFWQEHAFAPQPPHATDGSAATQHGQQETSFLRQSSSVQQAEAAHSQQSVMQQPEGFTTSLPGAFEADAAGEFQTSNASPVMQHQGDVSSNFTPPQQAATQSAWDAHAVLTTGFVAAQHAQHEQDFPSDEQQAQQYLSFSQHARAQQMHLQQAHAQEAQHALTQQPGLQQAHNQEAYAQQAQQAQQHLAQQPQQAQHPQHPQQLQQPQQAQQAQQAVHQASPGRTKGWFKTAHASRLPPSAAAPGLESWHPPTSYTQEPVSTIAQSKDAANADGEHAVSAANSSTVQSMLSMPADSTDTCLLRDSSSSIVAASGTETAEQCITTAQTDATGKVEATAAHADPDKPTTPATVAVAGKLNAVAIGAADSFSGMGASSGNFASSSAKSVSGPAAQKSPEQRAALAKAKGWAAKPLLPATATAGAASSRAVRKSREERAALAKAKGWAAKPLMPDSAPAGPKAGWHTAVEGLPWKDNSLRFSSAPVVEDDDVKMGSQPPQPATIRPQQVSRQLPQQADSVMPEPAAPQTIAANPSQHFDKQHEQQWQQLEQQQVELQQQQQKQQQQLHQQQQQQQQQQQDELQQQQQQQQEQLHQHQQQHQQQQLQVEPGSSMRESLESGSQQLQVEPGSSMRESLESSSQQLQELRQSFLDLRGQGDEQFDWEARAQWDADSFTAASPIDAAAEAGTVLDAEDLHDTLSQPTNGKAAAAAALQRAFSNIQLIATASQRRAAAAAAWHQDTDHQQLHQQVPDATHQADVFLRHSSSLRSSDVSAVETRVPNSEQHRSMSPRSSLTVQHQDVTPAVKDGRAASEAGMHVAAADASTTVADMHSEPSGKAERGCDVDATAAGLSNNNDSSVEATAEGIRPKSTVNCTGSLASTNLDATDRQRSSLHSRLFAGPVQQPLANGPLQALRPPSKPDEVPGSSASQSSFQSVASFAGLMRGRATTPGNGVSWHDMPQPGAARRRFTEQQPDGARRLGDSLSPLSMDSLTRFTEGGRQAISRAALPALVASWQSPSSASAILGHSSSLWSEGGRQAVSRAALPALVASGQSPSSASATLGHSSALWSDSQRFSHQVSNDGSLVTDLKTPSLASWRFSDQQPGTGLAWQSLALGKGTNASTATAEWSSLKPCPQVDVINIGALDLHPRAETQHSKTQTGSSSQFNAERSSFLIGTRYSNQAAPAEADAAGSEPAAAPVSASGLLHGAVSVRPYGVGLSSQAEKLRARPSVQQQASLGSGQLYSSPVATALSDSPWSSPTLKSGNKRPQQTPPSWQLPAYLRFDSAQQAQHGRPQHAQQRLNQYAQQGSDAHAQQGAEMGLDSAPHSVTHVPSSNLPSQGAIDNVMTDWWEEQPDNHQLKSQAQSRSSLVLGVQQHDTAAGGTDPAGLQGQPTLGHSALGPLQAAAQVSSSQLTQVAATQTQSDASQLCQAALEPNLLSVNQSSMPQPTPSTQAAALHQSGSSGVGQAESPLLRHTLHPQVLEQESLVQPSPQAAKLTHPASQLVQSQAEPVQHLAQANQLEFRPIQPDLQPIQLELQPSQPAQQPIQPVSQPVQPDALQIQRALQPIQPAAQPIQPAPLTALPASVAIPEQAEASLASGVPFPAAHTAACSTDSTGAGTAPSKFKSEADGRLVMLCERLAAVLARIPATAECQLTFASPVGATKHQGGGRTGASDQPQQGTASNSNSRSSSRHSMQPNNRQHAQHRLDKQWPSISRRMLRSDSEESEGSSNDIYSTADQHSRLGLNLNSDTHPVLQQVQQTKPQQQDEQQVVAVQDELGYESVQSHEQASDMERSRHAAVHIECSSIARRSAGIYHRDICPIGKGSCMHVPLVPGVEVHVSVSPRRQQKFQHSRVEQAERSSQDSEQHQQPQHHSQDASDADAAGIVKHIQDAVGAIQSHSASSGSNSDEGSQPGRGVDPLLPRPAPAPSHRQTVAAAAIRPSRHRQDSRHVSRPPAQHAKHARDKAAPEEDIERGVTSAGAKRASESELSRRPHRQHARQEQQEHSFLTDPGVRKAPPQLKAVPSVKSKHAERHSRHPRTHSTQPGPERRSMHQRYQTIGEAGSEDAATQSSNASCDSNGDEGQLTPRELSTHAKCSRVKATSHLPTAASSRRHKHYGQDDTLPQQVDPPGNLSPSSDGGLQHAVHHSSPPIHAQPRRHHELTGHTAAEQRRWVASSDDAADGNKLKWPNRRAALSEGHKRRSCSMQGQLAQHDLQRQHAVDSPQHSIPHKSESCSSIAAAGSLQGTKSEVGQQQQQQQKGSDKNVTAEGQQLLAEAQLPVQALMTALQNMLNLGGQSIPEPPPLAGDPPQQGQHSSCPAATGVSAVADCQAADVPAAARQAAFPVPPLPLGSPACHVSGQLTGHMEQAASGQQHEESDLGQARQADGSMAYRNSGMLGGLLWPDRQDLAEDFSLDSVLSPEASQRITAAACSVAEQVDRAVNLAVQAISPGRLPLSMSSSRFGQDVTEESHIAMLRNRILQQMQQATDPYQTPASVKGQPPCYASYPPGVQPQVTHSGPQPQSQPQSDSHSLQDDSAQSQQCCRYPVQAMHSLRRSHQPDLATGHYHHEHQGAPEHQGSFRPRLASGHHHYLPQAVRSCETDSQHGKFGLSPRHNTCSYSCWQSQHGSGQQGATLQQAAGISLAANADTEGKVKQMGSQTATGTGIARDLDWDSNGQPMDGQSHDSSFSSSQQQQSKRACFKHGNNAECEANAAHLSAAAAPVGAFNHDFTGTMSPSEASTNTAATLLIHAVSDGQHNAAQQPNSRPQQPILATRSVNLDQSDAGSSLCTTGHAQKQAASLQYDKRQADTSPAAGRHLHSTASIISSSPGGVQQCIQESASAAQATSDGDSTQARRFSAVQRPGASLASCMPKLDKQLSARSNSELTAKEVAKLWGVNLRKYVGRGN